MKKLVASVVLGMAMVGGFGSMYVANTGCKSGDACKELIKKACKNADKSKAQKNVCELWKTRVNNGMDQATCESNLKHLK